MILDGESLAELERVWVRESIMETMEEGLIMPKHTKVEQKKNKKIARPKKRPQKLTKR